MSDFNALHNRAVWFDIPVSDLARAAEFYRAVLNVKVEAVDAGGYKFCVIEHAGGNGGCLVPNAKEISGSAGILLYMSLVQLALGFVRTRWFLGAAIIGATSLDQLVEDIAATQVELDAETLADIAAIQTRYPNPAG